MRNLVLACCLASLTVACGEDEPTGIVIGALIDQTGSNAESSWVQSIRLAIEQMNQALEGQGGGVRFSVQFSDSGNAPAVAAERAVDLVAARGARALMTDTTQVTEAVARLMYQPQPVFEMLVQCSGCTADTFLNPTATVPGDPVLQSLRTNSRRNLARTVMSTAPMAYVALDFFRTFVSPAGNPTVDRNGDRSVKLAFYGSDDTGGRATTDALIRVASEMFAAEYGAANAPGTRLRLERILHDASLAPGQIDFFADIARLTDTNTEDTTTGLSFGDATGADYIFVTTFARHAASFREAVFSNRASNVVPALYFDTFRQSGTLYQLGATAVEGAEGISPVVISDSAAGATFASDFVASSGFDPNLLDAQYYDNAVTIMLAALIGGAGSNDPVEVTPAQIAASLPFTSAVTAERNGGAAPERVGPGVAALSRAVAAIGARRPIDYDGASGPVDYDGNNNVATKLTIFRGSSGTFADIVEPIDCLASQTTCGVDP